MKEIDEFIKAVADIVGDGLIIERILMTESFHKALLDKGIQVQQYHINGIPITVYDAPMCDKFGNFVNYYIDWRIPNEPVGGVPGYPIISLVGASSDVGIDMGSGFRFKPDPPKVMTFADLMKIINKQEEYAQRSVKVNQQLTTALNKYQDLYKWRSVADKPKKDGEYSVAILSWDGRTFSVYVGEYSNSTWSWTEGDDAGSEMEGVLLWTNIPTLPNSTEIQESEE